LQVIKKYGKLKSEPVPAGIPTPVTFGAHGIKASGRLWVTLQFFDNPKGDGSQGMSVYKRISLAAAALFALAVVVVGCGSGNIAKINGRSISRADYYQRLERLQVPSPRGGQTEAGAVVIQRLIDESLILELAKKQKVYPIEQQIKEREAQAKSQPEVMRELREAGITKDQLKQMLTVEQAAFNLQTRGITVPEKDIKEYYNKNKAVIFTQPEQASISIIVLKDKAGAEKANGLLSKGVDFGTVARSMSLESTTAQQGGRLPRPIAKGDQNIPENLQKAVFTTKAGGITKPLQLGASLVIIKVDSRKPAITQPFEKVKFDIRQQLMIQKGAEKQIDVNSELNKFKSEANIQVNINRYKPMFAPQPKK
jgi:foldase protein PrsA